MTAEPSSSPEDATAPTQCPVLDATLTYASRGWGVFPLHTPIGAGCSCGNPECERPGKHPRTLHGFRDASWDEKTIRQWWTQWPDANIGITTGAASGIVVFDIDPRHGGDDMLAEWEREHAPIPDTVEVCTGGGGRHIFFAHPGGHVKSRGLAPGIDVKADGGYIVAPPSLHASGRRYEWELSSPPDETPLAPLPEWLAAKLTSPSFEPRPASASAPVPIRDGRRNATLTSLAGTMRRRGMSEEAICASLLAENRRRCDPPLSDDEVRRIARSVARYEPAADPALSADVGVIGDPPWNTLSWPNPPAQAAFHGLAGDFVRAIEPHTEADPVALLISCFVAVGSVIGRGPHFVADAAKHYTNLNAVLVGRTARGRKGSSWAQVRRPFETVDSDWTLACI